MKTIAIMQPVYLPWLGYFEQMAVCDEFMFLDDVQYTRHDWRNRNKLRTKDGWMWLTVPIRRARLSQMLLETQINFETNWAKKQLSAISTNYRPSPYFHEIFPIIQSAFEIKTERLIDLTIPLVLSFAAYLEIRPQISYASQFPGCTAGGQERVLDLCKIRSAGTLYIGQAAKAYTSKDHFSENGVNVLFQNYNHPVYPQRFKGFESHMSIIDLLMNHGPRSREILLSSPLPPEIFHREADGG